MLVKMTTWRLLHVLVAGEKKTPRSWNDAAGSEIFSMVGHELRKILPPFDTTKVESSSSPEMLLFPLT